MESILRTQLARRAGWLERPVFVLGAGFSRAISERMPVTAQLRDELERRLGVRVPDDVEGWLSYLASSQPFLDQAANYRNRALYYEASKYIAIVIRSAAREVRKDIDPPGWLVDFAAMVIATGADVITFNYDDLLERCAPELAFGPGRISGPRRRILKLHGSITESWDPQESGSFHGPTGQSRGPVWDEDRPEPYQWLDDGRWEPFIVPPVQEKSPLYDIPELRDRWLKAATRLRHSSSIILLGYSLPLQDFSTHALLTQAATANADEDLPDPHELCPLVGVADLHPDPVTDRLRAGGVPAVGRLGAGPDSIADAVSVLSNEVWRLIAFKLESSRWDLETTPLEFEFGFAGGPRGGVAAQLGSLADVTTAAELVDMVEDDLLQDTTYADRIPVGAEVFGAASRGQPAKVHIWLGGRR